MSTMDADPVDCWHLEECGWIKPFGQGTFLNSPSVKIFAKKMLALGVQHFVVDLSSCAGLDSTFMGTLAGIALRLREIGHGSVEILNPSPEHQREMCLLGLDELFEFRRSA